MVGEPSHTILNGNGFISMCLLPFIPFSAPCCPRLSASCYNSSNTEKDMAVFQLRAFKCKLWIPQNWWPSSVLKMSLFFKQDIIDIFCVLIGATTLKVILFLFFWPSPVCCFQVTPRLLRHFNMNPGSTLKFRNGDSMRLKKMKLAT